MRHLVLLAVLLITASTSLSAQALGAIAGRVVGAQQQPIANAQVDAFVRTRLVRRATTDATGAYRLTALEAGTYRILVRAFGRTPHEDTVTVAAGTTATVDVSMTESAVLLAGVAVTGSRGAAAQKIIESPSSISVVGTEAIAETPATTVTDNLRGVPGIDIAQGGLQQSNIVARGFNNVFSGSLLTLIDNRYASVPSLRVNSPGLFTTTNEDIERIEVLLGPAAALYGPNSANGVLHIITKSPFSSPGSILTLDAGERSVVRVAGRHAAVLGSSLAMKLTGEYMRGREWEFRDPAEPQVFPRTPNTPASRVGQANARDFDVRRMGGEARVDWLLGDRTEWVNSYGVTRLGNAIELTGANGAAQIRNWTMQSLHSRFRSGRLFAQAFANLSDAGNDDSTDVTGTFILRTGQPIVDQSRVLSAQVQHSAALGARQEFIYGLDYTKTDPRTGNTINGRNEDDDNTTEVGGYLQSTTRMTPRLDLQLAARLDRHDRLEGTFFSPRAALVFKPRENQNFRLTFNRAYSTPANFSFFLDLLQAANISQLPFNVRAVGVPETGFRFRRDCAGGAGSLCMRSPFTPAAAGGPGAYVPANAAAYYGAALQVALAGGLRNGLIAAGLSAPAADATIQRLQTFNAVGAGVQTNLTYVTNGQTVAPDQVRDIERLKASFTNVLEIGYKGQIGRRFVFAADVWHQQRENFITPATNFTPNTLLQGQTLAAGLIAHLTPVLGPAGAAQVGASVAGSLARIPLGTVVPDSRVTTNGDIAFTYISIDETIRLNGADMSFDFTMSDAWSVLGTASWVSKNRFDEITSGLQPLLLNAPDRKGSLALRGRSEKRRLSGEVRGRYQAAFDVNSAVFVTGVDLTGPTGTYQYEAPPSAAFLDAQVTWRLPFRAAGDGALVTVSGTNLTDKKVPLFAGVPEIGRLIMTRLQLAF